MEEHVLKINSFNQPKILTGTEAIYTLIIRLFLMDKGTNKAHPDMGLGLLKRYRYYDADKLDDIVTDAYDQISRFIPLLTVTSISVSYSSTNNSLIITVTVDNDIYYVFSADFEEDTITLSDIVG